MLGWQLRQWKLVENRHLIERQTWLIRALAIAVFVVWAATLVIFIDFWKSIDVHWLFYDDSYDGLGQSDWWAGLVRLAFLLLAALLSAAFFVLVPRSETWITGFGQATMYVSLLHSFILYPLRETGIRKNDPAPDLLLVAVILAGIAERHQCRLTRFGRVKTSASAMSAKIALTSIDTVAASPKWVARLDWEMRDARAFAAAAGVA